MKGSEWQDIISDNFDDILESYKEHIKESYPNEDIVPFDEFVDEYVHELNAKYYEPAEPDEE
jgi:hypothetical protein